LDIHVLFFNKREKDAKQNKPTSTQLDVAFKFQSNWMQVTFLLILRNINNKKSLNLIMTHDPILKMSCKGISTRISYDSQIFMLQLLYRLTLQRGIKLKTLMS
jgi:hypothetical protein